MREVAGAEPAIPTNMPNTEKVTKLETILRKSPYFEYEPREGHLLWSACCGSKKYPRGHIGMVQKAKKDERTGKIKWVTQNWMSKGEARKKFPSISIVEKSDLPICPQCSPFPPNEHQ